MARVCMVQQVQFIPRLHYWHRVMHSDVLVIMDSTPLGKHYEAKTPIKTKDGVLWLTVPVLGRHHGHDQWIRDVKIDWGSHWASDAQQSLWHAYRKAKFFDEVFEMMMTLLNECRENEVGLFVTDLLFFERIRQVLDVRTKIAWQCELGPFRETKGDLMMAITKAVGCDTYHCGSEAPGMIIDVEKIQRNGIDVRVQNWATPEYPQLWGPFQPNMSVIDALMNIGIEGTKEVLK